MNLLDIKENGKLIFQNEINSLEFVELIGDMDLSYSMNYIKRDLYLKKLGQRLFKDIKQKKIRRRKIKINVNYDKVYISEKASKGKIKLFIKKLFNLNIVININLLKFINYSDKYMYYSNSINNKKTEVLSQDEIDLLLTPINYENSNDENNNKEIKIMSQDEVDKILTTINDGSDSSDS